MGDPSPDIVELAKRCHLAGGSEELESILDEAFAPLRAELDTALRMKRVTEGHADSLEAENKRLNSGWNRQCEKTILAEAQARALAEALRKAEPGADMTMTEVDEWWGVRNTLLERLDAAMEADGE